MHPAARLSNHFVAMHLRSAPSARRAFSRGQKRRRKADGRLTTSPGRRTSNIRNRPLADVLDCREAIRVSMVGPEGANEPMMLTVGDCQPVWLSGEAALAAGLAGIDNLTGGQLVVLQQSPKHYIKATRKGAFWSVSFRKGPIWTLNGFSPEGTSEYSDRKVKESRSAGSLFNRIRVALASPAPANALSTKQVEELFRAYLLGIKFPISPGIGAG